MDLSVSLLTKVPDHPLFEGLAFGDTPSVLQRKSKYYESDRPSDDFFPAMPVNWNWKLERLAAKWNSPAVAGEVMSFNDFPCLNLCIPAFSGRAATILRDFLEPNGELLPVTNAGRTYFAYNCLTIVEILDHLKTIGAFHNPYSPRKGIFNVATSISYMTVIPDRLDGLSIFRLRELPNCVFVTNAFVERVRAHGLNGFDFVKAWPMPEGTDFEIDHLKRMRQSQENELVQTNHGMRPARLQSVVIELSLTSNRILPWERKRVSQIERELSAQLLVRRLDENYFGKIEDRQIRKGICRLRLSCPDSAGLYEKLLPWINQLQWPNLVKVYVREKQFDEPTDEGRVFEFRSS